MAYRIVIHKGSKTEQVFVDWKGLPSSEQTWEDLEWVAHLNPDSNLEDKVRLAGEGDVTIVIDQAAAEKVLESELRLERNTRD